MIDRVTITGADDSIGPADLLLLSKEFPFVEWGILFGSQPGARPRFPSDEWTAQLARLAKKENLQLSAHLCGRWVRDWVLHANPSWRAREHSDAFQRIQLNFHGQYHKAAMGFIATLRRSKDANQEFIFQHDGVNDGLISTFTSGASIRAFVLHDVSGGAGVLPESWPAPIGAYCGYAGGLGPDNLKEQIELILAITGDTRIWIDMETRVRSEDDARFELDKVRKCLVIAEAFVAAGHERTER